MVYSLDSGHSNGPNVSQYFCQALVQPLLANMALMNMTTVHWNAHLTVYDMYVCVEQ
jgi:hypothetical protein